MFDHQFRSSLNLALIITVTNVFQRIVKSPAVMKKCVVV